MSEIISVINRFLNKQKNDFLDKKVAQETRDKKSKYEQLLEKQNKSESDVEKLAQEKNKLDEATVKAMAKFQPEADSKYEIITWLNKVASKVKPNITTHPAKFTNPKIKGASPVIFYGQSKNDGYLKTGNANLDVRVDVSGDAATNTLIFELYCLLEETLNDGSQLISSFENDSPELIEVIKTRNFKYTQFKELCLEVFYGANEKQTTHELIRQIYFPVPQDSKGYHLLSVITPSMLLFAVKNRIDDFNRWSEGQPIRAFKKDNKFHPAGFDEVFGLTEIGFSHNEFTKMGNVSYLNVRNKGIAYLLPSLPPEIKQRQIRLPTHNFFRNSLRTKSFQEAFQSLDKLIRADVNNIHIRQGISNSLKYVIDQVLQRAFSVRDYGPGWSATEHYQSLPLAQRIWLDDAYLEQRQNQDDWLDEVVREFARWLLDSYEYLFKASHIKLSDHELRELRSIVAQAVSSDQEFFK